MMTLKIHNVGPGHGVIVDKMLTKEYQDYITRLKQIVIESFEKGLIPEEIIVPEFYEPAAD